MKEKWHILGIDDSPFSRRQKYSTLVGVLMSHDFHVDGIITEKITVDGTDSENAILGFLDSGIGKAANAVFTNGITFAGFNMLDPVHLYEASGIPVISVTRGNPDLKSMKDAIIKHERDESKIHLLERLRPERMELGANNVLYVNIAGIENDEALMLLKKSIFRGKMPEAVRVAHMVGSVIKNGKTHGRV